MSETAPPAPASPEPTSPGTVPTPRSKGRRTFDVMGTALGPFLGLILVFLIFAVVDYTREGSSRQFASGATVQKVLRDASLVGVAALGMTLIIIAGGIDLSAGAATALCATVTAWCLREGYGIGGAICGGVATGAFCGLVNGTLISTLRVVPFIITLGTMTAFNGLGLILANDTPIRVFNETPDWVRELQTPYPIPPYLLDRAILPIPHWFDTEWGRIPLLVPTGVWLMLLLAVLVWVVLRFTVFGRHVFAVGSNEEAARLCGINVLRMRIAVYSLAGLFVGVAGLFQFAELSGQGDPNAGSGKELDYIAAVVIGGGSLNGGRGSVVGTLVGACIMATIVHGCVTVGVSSSWRMVILGVIIIAAVTLDQFRQRRAV